MCVCVCTCVCVSVWGRGMGVKYCSLASVLVDTLSCIIMA